MSDPTITSVKDERIQTARALTTRAGRIGAGLALADGARLVTQILAAGTPVEAVLVPDGRVDPGLAAEAERTGVELQATRPGVLRHVLASATPPDAIAVVPFRAEEAGTTPAGSLTVVCDGVADPGNLGSIFRTAMGLGCDAVVVTGDIDPTGRRVVEASRGAVLRAGVHRFPDGPAAVSTLRDGGWLVIAADGAGDVTFDEVGADAPDGRPVALVVGNETDGLDGRVRRAAEVVARIDLVAGVESLNVGVATGIALHVLVRRAGRVPGGRP